MIKEKPIVNVIYDIQRKLDNANLPVKVKVDIGEALEGADIGLKVYVAGKRNWELHKKINSIIRRSLREQGLMAYIDWHYNTPISKNDRETVFI
ncbi:hypothetical protein GWK41_09980 [Persephonella atlantica]|uniref:MIP18 family-like domain-containing protein n=1 Tax=Persephonella atlantica TaxID=2699429 RepID=A0ABS1GKE9_9AQUI|nr:hypothetical protein [Persephonella atlantica]MBK3333392.1 hypothetical protein [Persephonella atlantica]